MSWSVDVTGTPGAVQAELNRYAETLTGQSKEEFDVAVPHLSALVGMNFSTQYPGAIRLVANGHKSSGYGTCSVKIESVGKVVT